MMTLLGQHGVAQDAHRGLELIKFSADHADENSPQGAYIYGMLLAKELPQIPIPEYALNPDMTQAKTYVEKAAFLGFAKAQTKLGKAYEHGELGCYFDAALSLHYSNLAARERLRRRPIAHDNQHPLDGALALARMIERGNEGTLALGDGPNPWCIDVRRAQ